MRRWREHRAGCRPLRYHQWYDPVGFHVHVDRRPAGAESSPAPGEHAEPDVNATSTTASPGQSLLHASGEHTELEFNGTSIDAVPGLSLHPPPDGSPAWAQGARWDVIKLDAGCPYHVGRSDNITSCDYFGCRGGPVGLGERPAGGQPI